MTNSRELSNYFIDISTINLPLKLYDLFNNPNNNVLEIGFGEGEYLIDLATRKKQTNFIGLEIKRKRFLKAVRKARELKLDNIKFLHFDAAVAMNQLFGERSFINILINFPDPWPKLKHHKHRIFNQEFLLRIHKVLHSFGHIYISSDHKEYIINIMDEFNRTGKFKIVSLLKKTPDTAIFSNNKSRFEKEFIYMGKDIYYLNYMKI